MNYKTYAHALSHKFIRNNEDTQFIIITTAPREKFRCTLYQITLTEWFCGKNRLDGNKDGHRI